jgi:hypothetical protein
LLPAVCWAFAATWAPCSTANKRCCADPEDACVYKDASWSRCEPKSGRAAGARSAGCSSQAVRHSPAVAALHVPAYACMFHLQFDWRPLTGLGAGSAVRSAPDNNGAGCYQCGTL